MIKPMVACMLLSAVAFVPRVFPFLLGNQLKKSVHLNNLARSLPPCIMLLLVAHALQTGEVLSYPGGVCQVLGILAIIVTHLIFRKMLVSMAVGFFVYQALLHYV